MNGEWIEQYTTKMTEAAERILQQDRVIAKLEKQRETLLEENWSLRRQLLTCEEGVPKLLEAVAADCGKHEQALLRLDKALARTRPVAAKEGEPNGKRKG